eukprot:439532-Prorocentrum_minimum.AAC.1
MFSPVDRRPRYCRHFTVRHQNQSAPSGGEIGTSGGGCASANARVRTMQQPDALSFSCPHA